MLQTITVRGKPDSVNNAAMFLRSLWSLAHRAVLAASGLLDADSPLAVEASSGPCGHAPARFEVLPQALRMLVP